MSEKERIRELESPITSYYILLTSALRDYEVAMANENPASAREHLYTLLNILDVPEEEYRKLKELLDLSQPYTPSDDLTDEKIDWGENCRALIVLDGEGEFTPCSMVHKLFKERINNNIYLVTKKIIRALKEGKRILALGFVVRRSLAFVEQRYVNMTINVVNSNVKYRFMENLRYIFDLMSPYVRKDLKAIKERIRIGVQK